MGAEKDVPVAGVAPAARLAVTTPPTSRPSVEAAPAGRRPLMPAMPVRVEARGSATAKVTAAPTTVEERPALVSGDIMPPPGPPQFVQAARRLVTPAPALAPRIPNLLVSQRRYAQGASNYGGQPAAPITTSPVNNLQGTSALPLLPPFMRDIAVEIAPPAAPLPFDRAPYVQAPGAEDDADAPATMAVEAVRPRAD
jgi:hypothetical protein